MVVCQFVVKGMELEEWVWWYHIETAEEPGCLSWLVPWGKNFRFLNHVWIHSGCSQSYGIHTLYGCFTGSSWFSQQCFTMDEKRSKAVIEAFVRLYKGGLIYRYVWNQSSADSDPWICNFGYSLKLILCIVVKTKGKKVGKRTRKRKKGRERKECPTYSQILAVNFYTCWG